MIFSEGDRCIVEAIGEASPWYNLRELIIGREVVFMSYAGQEPDQTFDGGFIQCFIKPLVIPGRYMLSCFYRVKLKKVG